MISTIWTTILTAAMVAFYNSARDIIKGLLWLSERVGGAAAGVKCVSLFSLALVRVRVHTYPSYCAVLMQQTATASVINQIPRYCAHLTIDKGTFSLFSPHSRHPAQALAEIQPARTRSSHTPGRCRLARRAQSFAAGSQWFGAWCRDASN